MAKRDIIVVGSSAGGLKPLLKLVGSLPAGFDASIFIARHYPPGEDSELASLLSGNGPVPASEATHGARIERNRIYIAPTNQQLVLKTSTIVFEPPLIKDRLRPTINALFVSAAHTFGFRVIGIVLSGALDDGAEGLSVIKAAGGISIVQKPSDATVKSMPEKALKLQPADYVLPAGDIGTLLSTLIL